MKLINPVNVLFALMASIVCLAYGTRPFYGKQTVNFVAGNGTMAAYLTSTGAVSISAPCGCGAVLQPDRPRRFGGLIRFVRFVKLAHSGAINHG